MTMTPDQSKQTLINTDYPLDKVIARFTGSVSIGSGLGSFNDVTTAHGFSFPPLTLAMYSTSSDFTIGYEYNTGPIATNTAVPSPFSYSTSVESNPTNIILRHTNWSGSAVTLYYRVYCFMPSNQNEDAAFTNTTPDNFILNTDYNYTKLFAKGVTSYSSTTNSTVTINHNLGYIPQVIAWTDTNGSPVTVGDKNYTRVSSSGVSQNSSVRVTTSDIIYERASFLVAAERLHYRIYIDE